MRERAHCAIIEDCLRNSAGVYWQFLFSAPVTQASLRRDRPKGTLRANSSLVSIFEVALIFGVKRFCHVFRTGCVASRSRVHVVSQELLCVAHVIRDGSEEPEQTDVARRLYPSSLCGKTGTEDVKHGVYDFDKEFSSMKSMKRGTACHLTLIPRFLR